jgi:hypothetical protein
VLLNTGLAGSFVTILLQSPWKIAFSLVVAVALGLYSWELAAILRARKRRTLDWGIRYFLTAITFLAPLTFLSVVLSTTSAPGNPLLGQLENLYGFLGFMGLISLALIGMLYKIVPFLIWFIGYSPEIGRAQVPSLSDLYSSRLQAAGYWFYTSGVIVTGIGIVPANEDIIRFGCALLALSLTTLLVNVAAIFRHLIRPRLRPFAIRPAALPRPA